MMVPGLHALLDDAYSTSGSINLSLHIIHPTLEDHFFVFNEFFQKFLSLLMYAWYLRWRKYGVCNY